MSVTIDEADVGGGPLPEDKLERVIALATRLEEQKAAHKAAEDEAKALKKALLKTEREDLPDLMSELGIPSLKLPSGATVSVVEDATCSITQANHGAAMAWLIEHGYGGLIKTSVGVTFGRGEREEALNAVRVISDAGMDPELVEAVHHSTLRAFVKERLGEGAAIPFDLFSIRPFNKATIKK